MTDAFLSLIDPAIGRVVNVGSGAGPAFVQKQSYADKKFWRNPNVTWEEIEAKVNSYKGSIKGMEAYGLSKAGVSSLAMYWAKKYPNIQFSSISPGFIDTAIVKGFGAKLKPEQGTRSIRHCLFHYFSGNGYYFGSDAKRSPLHMTREPGTPEYKGD